jgi:hypothetical protein
MYGRQYPNTGNRVYSHRNQPFDENPEQEYQGRGEYRGPGQYARPEYNVYRRTEPTSRDIFESTRTSRPNQGQIPFKQNRGTEGDYWYTPEAVLETVHTILHDYFDPCPIAPEFNGLEIEWPETCFINPPFSLFKEFVEKGLREWTPGKTFLWLVNADFKNETAKTMASIASAIAITGNPIQFRPGHSSLKSVGNAWNSVLILWSTDEQILTAYKEALSGDCIVFTK